MIDRVDQFLLIRLTDGTGSSGNGTVTGTISAGTFDRGRFFAVTAVQIQSGYFFKKIILVCVEKSEISDIFERDDYESKGGSYFKTKWE